MLNLRFFIPATFLLATASWACELDLKYRCDYGNYLIVNPDPETYTGITARTKNNSQCSTAVEGGSIFTVTDCDQESVQIELLKDDGTVSCEILCGDAERSQSGYSVPLDFVLESQSIIRSGSAHFFCHPNGTVFIKNPRSELYTNSIAYSRAADVNCPTKHVLDNQVIEVSACESKDSQIGLVVGTTDNLNYEIARKTDFFILDCPANSPVIGSGENNGMKYNCFQDGTILAVNPRSELFCFSYAEQEDKICNSVYVKSFSNVIISGCDASKPILLLLSKVPIQDDALIIRPNNVFLIDCGAV